MLIRYSVSNFRSYKNEATLDFVTNSKISTNKSHEYRFGRLSVLKNIGIFGSNAYGKSNLIKSIQAMQLIISRNVTPENFSFVGQEDIPTTFRMLFSIENNEFYEYSFSIVRIPNSVCFNVVDEELYIQHVTRPAELLYSKSKNILKSKNSTLKIFLEGYKRLDSQLFLNYINAAERRIDDCEESDIFFKVFKYLYENIIAFSDERQLMYMLSKESILSVNEYLNKYDIGIKKSKFIEISENESIGLLNDPLTKNIFLEAQKPPYISRYICDKGNIYNIENNNGKIEIKKLMFEHQGFNCNFSYGYESEGTKRIFTLLATLMNDANRNKTIFIDEIERSAYPEIITEIIKDFQEKFKDEKAQLVFSTHHTPLIKYVLRNDEVYFIDKLPTGSSTIYPLTDFKILTRDNVEKNFKNGLYGGVPNIGVTC